MRTILRAVGVASFIGVLGVAVAAGLFFYSVYDDRTLPSGQTQVIVARGATFDDIAAQLAQRRVIGNAVAFRVLARLRHVDVDVHAGAYSFPPHRTSDEVLRALLSSGAQIAAWVTIPEGFTASQIAQRLQDDGIGRADESERVFKNMRAEGYLFPNTYLVPLDSSPDAVAKQMMAEFARELPADAKARARALGITVAQGVTVASLIEREAKADSDRPLIASVIYNRLRLRMPLQIDATIEYALPEHKAALSFADLKIDSPYNTYLHEGLPPTPIANPGRPSLEAAFHPARTDALYYVYCGNGHHVFAKTLEEHQANVARCLH
ncbi:MAG TPA: endolytic transglycosylase MltG [Candidatus Baltobacteraceae bacterium]|nr:endolytic transglycosylase MltG [Candidatus Baltobacteraceae bacterium]